MREENAHQKKFINDLNNKKIGYEMKLSELKTEIINHESKYKRKFM